MNNNGNDIPQKEKQKQVASGKVKQQSIFRMILDGLVSEEGQSLKEYAVKSLIVPMIQRYTSDISRSVADGIVSMITYKICGKEISTTQSNLPSYTMYYNGNRTTVNTNQDRRSFAQSVEYSTRAEAQAVLSALKECIYRYKSASVADMYDLSGITPQATDYSYGWTDLQSACVIQNGRGYILKMPQPIVLR